MIPRAYILQWQESAPWKTNAQIEHDLVISRALTTLYADEMIHENLAFRGGTALHKLFMKPQSRYSEDIDLVQITAKPFGPFIDRIREKLEFLGKPKKKQKERNNTLIFQFETEFQPVQVVKLKIETNCREHFSVLGYNRFPFEVKSAWFNGSCNITTYHIEELLGTKLRALYQRSKGRDLYDLYKALTQLPGLDVGKVMQCYSEYMKFVVEQPPSKQVFLRNLEEKMKDKDFLGDIYALIRSEETYDQNAAFELVKQKLIDNI
jgi:predicted nucleotidyltransferase component of viral defense system